MLNKNLVKHAIKNAKQLTGVVLAHRFLNAARHLLLRYLGLISRIDHIDDFPWPYHA